MIKNFKLTIEYEGTFYHGWQRQKSHPTLQAEIEKAITTMTGKSITVIGSGRTDAGVHAFGQVAHFKCDTRLGPTDLLKGLNALLPESMVIRGCEEVDEHFHARYDAKRKTYRYRILNQDLPIAIQRQYVWHIRHRLDIGAMRRASGHLVGRHDFKAFEGTGSPRSHSTRQVFKADIHREDEAYLIFEIEADGFLRFMVRNIVGTLVEVGTGKISPGDFKDILISGDRSRAGTTAPARGLFLAEVKY